MTFYDFLSWKNDVSVPSKSNKQKKLRPNYILLASWRSLTEQQDPDPLVRGTDSWIRTQNVTGSEHCFWLDRWLFFFYIFLQFIIWAFGFQADALTETITGALLLLLICFKFCINQSHQNRCKKQIRNKNGISNVGKSSTIAYVVTMYRTVPILSPVRIQKYQHWSISGLKREMGG